jgi:putative ABC transport system ATP-binding protein
MVTHDPVAASHADRILFLADGRIVRDTGRSAAEEISAFMLSMEVAA